MSKVKEVEKSYPAHKQRLDDAAARLAVRVPFIATLFSSMRRSVTETLPTAGTNGLAVMFNPNFMDAMDDDELLFVCAHEAMHVAMLHSYRRGDRDPALWNIAGDAVINLELTRNTVGMKMPTGKHMGVIIPWVKPDMDSETVYQKLMDDPNMQKMFGSGGFKDENGEFNGDLQDASGEQEGESEDEVRIMVTQAAKIAFASGDKSALVERVLNIVRASNTDWREETREMLTGCSRDDYSYRRFARRFIANGMYLPSLYSESLGPLVIGVDTSGSITQAQLDRIAADTMAIVEDCRPAETIIIYCDCEVNHVDRFPQGETITMKMHGGGGTAFKPVFDKVEELGLAPAGMVYFTDLEGNYHIEPPAYPVLWGAVNASQQLVPDFGRRVEVPV